MPAVPDRPRTRTLLLLLIAWDVAWRGPALWRAARRNEPGWFVPLLVLNTAGVLPIVYLLLHEPVPVEVPSPHRLAGA